MNVVNAVAALNSAMAICETSCTQTDIQNIIAKIASLQSAIQSLIAAIAPIDASLKATSTVKGQILDSLGTPNATLGSETAGAVTITAAEAADTTNGPPFITLFDPTYAGATVKVVKYASGGSTANFATDTAYANEAITDGDFFIIRVKSADTTKTKYYKVVVTVSSGSSDATLKTASTVKGHTVGSLGTPDEATCMCRTRSSKDNSSKGSRHVKCNIFPNFV